jgi:iron only hydrogenase large subunit-like protein
MKQKGITGPLASISPCIAKIEEHNSTGLVQYNITFRQLHAYLEKNKVNFYSQKRYTSSHNSYEFEGIKSIYTHFN